MSTKTVVVNDGVDLEKHPLLHGYPTADREGRSPYIGEAAICGYIREVDTQPGKWGTSEACIVCEHLVMRYYEL